MPRKRLPATAPTDIKAKEFRNWVRAQPKPVTGRGAKSARASQKSQREAESIASGLNP
jgi:hypothetical protein